MDSNSLSNAIRNNFVNFEENVEAPRRPLTFKEKIKCLFTGTLYLDFVPPAPIQGKKTLMLDLDETLIHTAAFRPDKSISYFSLGDTKEYVYKRPGLDEFLKYAYTTFDLFIFTASTENYANFIIDQICPAIDAEHRLFRGSCYPNGKYVKKDTSILNRNKTDLILVDDNYGVYTINRENALLIESWKGYPKDTELTTWLIPILERCKEADDVRSVISTVTPRRRMSNVTPYMI